MDITMCATKCQYSQFCKRHADSGSRAHKFQYYSMYSGAVSDPTDCDGWWPLESSIPWDDKSGK